MTETLSVDLAPAAPERLRPSLPEALLGVLLACLFMEAFLRAAAFTDRLELWLDPPAGASGEPAGVTVFQDGASTLRVPWRLNTAGFRDRDHAPAKPPGVTRVGLFGDSFLPGYAVAQDRILPRTLEAALGPGHEVLAFGSVGQGTRHQLVHLRGVASRYALDAAVLFFFQNDPWDNSPALSDGAGVRFRLDAAGRLEELPEVDPGHGARRSWLSRLLNTRCRLYRWQKQRVEVLEGWWKQGTRQGAEAVPKVYHPLLDPAPPAIQDAWRLTEALLEAFVAEARRQGVRVVLVDVPLQEAVFPDRMAASTRRYPELATLGLDWDRSRRVLGPLAARLGVPCMDLRRVLAEAPEGSGLIFEADGHFTARGHAAVGQAVARFLTAHPETKGITP